MGFKAADYCVTVVAIEKNGRKYGMSCAWMVQVDYDKILCLLGSQSVTGSVICKGDKVGVSTLNKNQNGIALNFGDNHSNEVDKFVGINYINKNGAICICDSSREMYCEVIDVLHLSGIEEDNLLYLKIVDSRENNEDFMHYGDL
jgi:flavin reductase (DIM6/NTAB) family NADH-FMN oxidoreductase RutF